MTLLLVVALLAGVGLATAAVAIRTTDGAVDRSLRDAATAAIAYLELIDVDAPATPSPAPSQSAWPSVEPSEGAEPSDDAEASDEVEPTNDEAPTDAAKPSRVPAGPDDSNEPETTDEPAAAGASGSFVLALAPQPATTLQPQLEADSDDQPLAASDTFFLVLDARGQLLSNPRRVLLTGLPDGAAAAAAAISGEDWRTVVADGAPVRLFTKRVSDGHGGPTALLQSGMVLRLQEVQRNEILMTIVLASLLGLLGAGVVSLLVTRRALAPIRSAFAAERRFVAAASHELRTPVALVHALAEVLQREGLVKPAGRQMVNDMIDETDRLGRLVGDLLALSSAEAGAVLVEPRPLEARSFVAGLARRVEGMAGQRGLSIELEQEGAVATPELGIVTDPDRLAQLLLIFVDNAIEHSPAGGVVRLTVRPAVDHGQAQVQIAVADHGPGVPSTERERIFEPFAKLAGRGRARDSTGLGLAIARILAGRLGATLRLDDAPTGGAVFSVTLAQRTGMVGDTGFEPVTPRM